MSLMGLSNSSLSYIHMTGSSSASKHKKSCSTDDATAETDETNWSEFTKQYLEDCDVPLNGSRHSARSGGKKKNKKKTSTKSRRNNDLDYVWGFEADE